MYLYCIRNKINGKQYIGQTIQEPVEDRWRQHLHELRTNNHDNPHLQNAWNKYGEENFEFIVLGKYSTLEELNTIESKLIEEGRKLNNVYNIKDGGQHGKHSEATKQKLSEAGKKRKGEKRRPRTQEEKEQRSKKLRKEEFPDVVDPNGDIHKIHTIRDFAKQHNLTRTTFRNILKREGFHHKGWRIATPETIGKVFTQEDINNKGERISKILRDNGYSKFEQWIISPEGKNI